MCALAISCHLNRSLGVLKNSPNGPGGNEEHEDSQQYNLHKRLVLASGYGNGHGKRGESLTNEERFMPLGIPSHGFPLNSTEATAVNVAQREPISSVPGADHVDLVVLDLGRGPHRRGS